jgi:hypothetical protein
MLERGVHRFVAELSRETGMLFKQPQYIALRCSHAQPYAELARPLNDQVVHHPVNFYRCYLTSSSIENAARTMVRKRGCATDPDSSCSIVSIRSSGTARNRSPQPLRVAPPSSRLHRSNTSATAPRSSAIFHRVSDQRMRNADVYYARSFHTIRRNSAINRL